MSNIARQTQSVILDKPSFPTNKSTSLDEKMKRLRERLDLSQYKYILTRKVVNLIKDLIRSCDQDEADQLKTIIFNELEGNINILSEIALDDSNLINVRAIAARLFFAKVTNTPLHHSLRGHRSSLIRLGVVYGLADSGQWEEVSKYLRDRHATVSKRTQEIIDDAD